MDLPRDLLAPPQRGGVTTFARIVSVNSDGTVKTVTQPGGCPVKARTIVDVGLADAGRQAVILIDPQQPDAPVILGIIREPAEETGGVEAGVVVDGGKVMLTAKDEIVLSCGEASITLTKSGRIVIRGNDILSRARLANKIKGGSIQLN